MCNHEIDTFLEDILLCDPISKRGRECLNRLSKIVNKTMTIEDFYTKIYVQPFFVDKIDEENNFDEDTENLESSITSVDIQNLKLKKEKFESLFFSESSDELLFIKASAGSGKSIYLNNLKRERRIRHGLNLVDYSFPKKRINPENELNYDLESSQFNISAGGMTFPSNNYDCFRNINIVYNSQWFFYIMILQSIFDICCEIIENNEIDRTNFEQRFYQIYGDDYTAQIEKILTLISSEHLPKERKERQELKSNILQIIVDACFDEYAQTAFNIEQALRVLFRILFLINDPQNPKQTLISFDNIEHLIKSKKRIYDEDIYSIISAVKNVVEHEKQHFEQKDLNFAIFFKIVMIIRDTTEKMIYGDIQDLFINVDKCINVAGWFELEAIYKNKWQYFALDEASPSRKLIKLITMDGLNNPVNNLMNQISIMYNHNNRRATRIIVRIAYMFNNLSRETSCISYDAYETLWEYHKKNHIKFLCRQSILRLIYNLIKNTNYFERLCIDGKSPYPCNTYTHRILTWLSNNDSHISKEYHSFDELMNHVFKGARAEIFTSTDDNLKEICKIFIALDEFRFSYENDVLREPNKTGPNYWCQLAIIKYNKDIENMQITPDLLANEIRAQLENRNDTKIGVQLTEAGYFLANKYWDYEMIMCRHTAYNYPLIFMTNMEHIVGVIEAVYETAFKTIKSEIKTEISLFGNNGASYEQLYHLKTKTRRGNMMFQSIPYRIVTQHISYLRAYMQYLSDKELSGSLNIFEDSVRNSLIYTVIEYIGKYTKLLDDVENLRGSVFRGYTGRHKYTLYRSENNNVQHMNKEERN